MTRLHSINTISLLGLFLGLLCSSPAQAVIILGNISTPNTSPQNTGTVPYYNGSVSVGSYEGTFGNFLGTPIAPDYFVTANHIGNAGGGTFTYDNGTNTPTTYSVTLAGVDNDLAIWKVAANGPSFSLYAPLYTSPNVAGQSLVQIGRGTLRGSPVSATVNGPVQGWQWGASTTATSWGTNTVVADAALSGAPSGFGGNLISFAFQNNGNYNESISSSGDSGGAIFIKDPVSGLYELAGINSLVDQVDDASGNPLNDAIFDARGFYSGGQEITGPFAIPLETYDTDINSRLAFIDSTIAVPEPGSLTLMALASSALVGVARSERKRRAWLKRQQQIAIT